ncbi:PEN family class A beta-lactamase, Bpc-type [Winogradskya consettensis]|uniref:Beta-lactamase n=1 Tax=Winogradskya consettensis TaxID=113560 RepID=A0A919SXK1_9ACTN|nr:class A beta-lactamase [Actinoplanes consettensis]GIM79519.1 beta-lactamase [Actinoplanes consettensis]
MVDHLSRRALLTGGATATAVLLLPGAANADSNLPGLEREYDARIGAYALDTGTGRTVEHRSREQFPLLSTFKVLASAAVLRRARTCDPGLLDRRVFFSTDDLVANSPVTSLHVEEGMSVAELCAAAIGYSDNTAGNLLLRLLGGPAGVTRYARGIGDPVTRLDRWETALNIWSPAEVRDTTTPSVMGRNLQALTLGHALYPDDRERLLGWLRANTTGGARIRAGLPPSWSVGDKTGSSDFYGAANDIAIVHPRKGAPLILAVYTNRNDATAPYDNTLIARTATALVRALGRL